MKIQTIPGLLKYRVERSPEAVAHWTLDRSGKWQPTTWEDFWGKANALAFGLRSLCSGKGQKIGIMAHTSQTWEFMQMAILMAGGTVVGIDPHDRADNIDEIARTADLSGMIVETPEQITGMAQPIRDKLAFVITLDGAARGDGFGKTVSIHELYEIGARECRSGSLAEPLPDYAATIIFTSGTTGTPKGIEYTHGQVLLACTSITEAFRDINEASHLVCWLPLSNLFQRMVNFCGMSTGAATYFIEDPREAVRHLPAINPHVFIGVPRFFEKLHQGIVAEIAGRPGWTRKLIEGAITIGDRYAQLLRRSQKPGLLLRGAHLAADRLVLRRLRGILGQDLRYVISGSAPMPRWLLEWFHSIGILILEAYGISENIVPNSMNRPDDYRFGTVGKTLPGNEITLADDGELLVRGEGVCSGYRGQPQGTLLTQGGYLATGDYGEIDGDGFITLTGRKSDIFKTSTGRRIAPVAIESRLLQLPYVEHAMVYGAGKQYLAALLCVSAPGLLLGGAESVSGGPMEGSVLPPEVIRRIREDITRVTADLPEYQRPAGILVTFRPFSITGGDLTSNLKLRRIAIMMKYRDGIEQLYRICDEAGTTGMVIHSL
jgi:long-chain acyl-CoA synthetase